MGNFPSSSYLADTHSILWHTTRSSRLSEQARRLFDEADLGRAGIVVSTISVIETIYLVEKRSIPSDSIERILSRFRASKSYMLVNVDAVVAEAVPRIERSAVPDMPDRIIAATALAYTIPLITKDERLRSCAGIRTLW